MKSVTIKIKCGNDAFGDSPAYEVARILRELAIKVVDGVVPPKILDSNGNTVGEIKIK